MRANKVRAAAKRRPRHEPAADGPESEGEGEAGSERGERRARERSMQGRFRRSYLWATLVFLAFSMLGHWFFGWRRFVHEAETHGQPAVVGEYVDEMARDTFENWQSEFLQLIWQVCGLAVFLYVGSPQSKEGHDRIEAKLDYLLSRTPGGDEVRRELDRSYLRED